MLEFIGAFTEIKVVNYLCEAMISLSSLFLVLPMSLPMRFAEKSVEYIFHFLVSYPSPVKSIPQFNTENNVVFPDLLPYIRDVCNIGAHTHNTTDRTHMVVRITCIFRLLSSYIWLH
jgi:hypothetical protein